ncbi:hypothetical protein BDAP_000612 [Binucleata daphniae]
MNTQNDNTHNTKEINNTQNDNNSIKNSDKNSDKKNSDVTQINKTKLIEKYDKLIIKTANKIDTTSNNIQKETQNTTPDADASHTDIKKAYKDIFEDFDPFANPGEGLMKNLYDKIQKTESKYKIRLLNKIDNIKHTIDVEPTKDVTWCTLGLSDNILKSIKSLEYEYPSPVQVNAIPHALNQKDLLIRSKNGTGKTLSYVIPILEMIEREGKVDNKTNTIHNKNDDVKTVDSKNDDKINTIHSNKDDIKINTKDTKKDIVDDNSNGIIAKKQTDNNTLYNDAHNKYDVHKNKRQTTNIRNTSQHYKNNKNMNFALIIVPTRELAMQVGKVFRKVGMFMSEEIMSTFGGSNYYEDILRIKKGVSVVVGTPGRILDLCNKNVIKIERFRVLVFDEADKVLAETDNTSEIGKIVTGFNSNRRGFVDTEYNTRYNDTTDSENTIQEKFEATTNNNIQDNSTIQNKQDSSKLKATAQDALQAISSTTLQAASLTISQTTKNSNTLRDNFYNTFVDKFLFHKQIFLLSATFPVQISTFVNKNMKNIEEINLMPELFLLGLGHHFIKVHTEKKLHCLYTLLRKIEYNKLIIFCNSVSSAEKLGYRIIQMGHPCYFFHSGLTMEDRKLIFHRYSTKDSDVKILIGTDLITRGIDIPEVNVVVNFEFPKSVESFLHRVGRAGRFGTVGISISLVNDDEIEDLLWVEKQTGVEIKGVTDLAFKETVKE